MKRIGNLFDRIVCRDNLRLAVYKALRRKRNKRDARAFVVDLEERLQQMAAQLLDGSCAVGQFHQFMIYDPKERLITAPCFAERVLHHAVMNVCEPVFERWLIRDTYACRLGHGREAAVVQAQRYAAQAPYFLKLDVRKYFDSIRHAELQARLGRLFKDHRLLELFQRILAGYRGDLGRGLPIGSLTSQHFANFYLGWFDRLVKETLLVKRYVRYMDDMVLWGESANELTSALEQCEAFLQTSLHLEFRPKPYINRTEHGVDFLGCRVFPDHVVLNHRSRRRIRRKLLGLEQGYLCAAIDEGELQQRATAVLAFARSAGVRSWQFRRALLQQLPVSGHRPGTG